MAILETAIMYRNIPLVERQYYSTEHVLDKNIRNGLLQAIHALSQQAFGESLQSFSLGTYSILLISSDFEIRDSENSASNKESILIYGIVDSQSNEKSVNKSMQEAIFQFLNRYSWNDIHELKLKKFSKFGKRMDKIFGDLILKSEDRFKSLF